MFDKVSDPTPQEIRDRCLKIQSEWSDEERKRRAKWIDSKVVALNYVIKDLVFEEQEEE